MSKRLKNVLARITAPSLFNQPLPYDEGFARQLLADPSRESLLVWADWLEEQAPEFAHAVRALAETSYRPFYSRVVDRVYWGLRSQKSSKELPKPLREKLLRECGLEVRSAVHGSSVFGVEVEVGGPIRFVADSPRAYMAALLAAAVVHENHP